ncbi:MAG: AAA family ATPase [Anaerolineae bacterium]|nr:AAA family ATPase [Anaerolineae bacterium]
MTAPAESRRDVNVLPDIPTEQVGQDKLNFGPYAQTLLDIILKTESTPLTIGIFGNWGTGKTSLMKMIEQGLTRASADGPEIYSIWFNAWLYSKEMSLWRALIMQVLTGIHAIRSLDAQAHEQLNALASQLHRAAGPSELGHLSIAAVDLLREEGTGSAQITLALQHGIDFLQNIAQAREKGEINTLHTLRKDVRKATVRLEQERIQSLEQFQDEFKKLIHRYVEPRGYLVIFVDDLDRCLPDKAVEVLEAIKLFLDVPGCIFILGIDHEVVQRGIRLRYGDMGGIGNREAAQLQIDRAVLEMKDGASLYRAFLQDLYTDAEDVIDGNRYLEKIIQIPFFLPPISAQAMDSFVAQLAPNLPDPRRCGSVFVAGLERNPRQVKRALNIFTLLWTLAQNQPTLQDHIKPVRLAKLVVLQLRHAELFKKVRQNPPQLIAWERVFRIQQDESGYREWAGVSPTDPLDSTSPEEIREYDEEKRLALAKLLTIHPLTGDDSKDANFIDMTPTEIEELIFLTRTSGAGAERAPKPEPPIKEPLPPQEEKEEDEEELLEALISKGIPSKADSREKELRRSRERDQRRFERFLEAVPSEEETAPIAIPLHQFLRLPERAGFTTQLALGRVADAAIALAMGKAISDSDLERLAQAGQDLQTDLLRGDADRFDELMDMMHQREVDKIQVLFSGSQGEQSALMPWELIAVDPEKNPEVEKITLEDFWGGRFIIERPLAPTQTGHWPPGSAPALAAHGDPLRVGMVLDWGLPADHALKLFKRFNDRISLQHIEEPDALRHSLTRDPADVYVFYSRGQRGNVGSEVMIGKGYPITARDVSNWTRSEEVPTKRSAQAERSPSPDLRQMLRDVLTTYFDEEELKTLCFDLGIRYDDLPAEGASGKARELIAYLERRGRIFELIEVGKQLRPDVPWTDVQQTRSEPSRPPILFYFCLDGNPKQELDWSGWPAALERHGAAGIVAPLIYTPGQWQLDMVSTFFDQFLSGLPVGTALREARRQIYEWSSNPLGLIVAHFGPPEMTLHPPTAAPR